MLGAVPSGVLMRAAGGSPARVGVGRQRACGPMPCRPVPLEWACGPMPCRPVPYVHMCVFSTTGRPLNRGVHRLAENDV